MAAISSASRQTSPKHGTNCPLDAMEAGAQPDQSDKLDLAAESTEDSRDNLKRQHTKSSEIKRKANTVRAGFQRPATWVLVFGWSLGLCAGLVNVVAFQVWGTFVSHVTGGTTGIGLKIEGYHTGRHDFAPLGRGIALLLSFLFGAFLCGLLIDKNHVHLGGKAFYGIALIGNAVLLVLSILVTLEGGDLLAACLAAAACGLQNAMCTSHFGAIVRTTHVTGTITDIGSTLGRMAMILLRKGCRASRLDELEQAEVGVDARKLLVLGPMWLCFLVGCMLGAYLGTSWGVYALLVPAGFSFLVGLVYMLFRQRLKEFFKKATKDRLSCELEDVETCLFRTQSILHGLKVGSMESVESSSKVANAVGIDLDDLESEVEHILDTVHQVEVDIQTLQAQRQASMDAQARSSSADIDSVRIYHPSRQV